MARWKLKDDCGFVEAYTGKDKKNKPPDVKKAKIIREIVPKTNAHPGQYECYEVNNDDAAFVARLIVQGVETSLVKEIILSEYSHLDDQEAQKYVDDVLVALNPYLEPAQAKAKPQTPPKITLNPNGKTSFPLDFKVNFIGYIVFKG